MKKASIITLAFLTGMISILYLNELFKALVAFIFGQETSAELRGILLNIHLIINSSTSVFAAALILASPYIASIILLEISNFILSRAKSYQQKSFLITYQLINIAYLLINTVALILSVLLKGSTESDWKVLIVKENIPYNEQMIFLLIILIFLGSYLNMYTKRIGKNIPAIKK